MKRRLLMILVLLVVTIVAVYAASRLPDADWNETFYPAARGIFSGHSPYERPVFVNPPWAILLLLPFVIFPADISRGLIFVVSVLVLVFIAWKTKNRPQTVVALLLSPTVIGSLLAANLDTLIIPAIFFPPAWALFFLMIKPQIGFGVAAYFLFTIFQKEKITLVLKIFAPVVIGYLLAGLIFPPFLGRILNQPFVNPWNRSIFPYGIPIGLFFLYFAVRRKNVFYALVAAPFFTPFLTFYSYLAVQVGLLNEDVENFIRRDVLEFILMIGLWVIMLGFHL